MESTFQEPMLAVPFQYLDYLPQMPTVARPLTIAKPKKVKDYLDLAKVLLSRFPTQTMARAVSFLLRVAQNTNPGPLGSLSWFSTPGRDDQIQIRNLAVLSKVAPAMKFRANLMRWRENNLKTRLETWTADWDLHTAMPTGVQNDPNHHQGTMEKMSLLGCIFSMFVLTHGTHYYLAIILWGKIVPSQSQHNTCFKELICDHRLYIGPPMRDVQQWVWLIKDLWNMSSSISSTRSNLRCQPNIIYIYIVLFYIYYIISVCGVPYNFWIFWLPLATGGWMPRPGPSSSTAICSVRSSWAGVARRSGLHMVPKTSRIGTCD